MKYRPLWFIGVVVASVLFTTLASQQTSAACAKNYVVKQSDSWWRIAEKSNTTLRKVLKLNNAKQSTRIQPGDEVCVPAMQTITPQPPKNSFTRAEVIQIIRDVWPDELEERALAIAYRESKYTPSALNRSKCCYGLFQIYYRWHTTWLPNVGVTNPSQLFDPRLNAAAAYRLYQRNGWGPWQ